MGFFLFQFFFYFLFHFYILDDLLSHGISILMNDPRAFFFLIFDWRGGIIEVLTTPPLFVGYKKKNGRRPAVE